MRREYLIDVFKEAALIMHLAELIKTKYPELSPENTLVLMVSPDYSASVAMHVAHHLSKDGEMCNILPIHVPYPDETNIASYMIKAEKDINDFEEFCGQTFENFLLVEAGVIRGGTYTWLSDIVKKTTSANIITAALFENTGSQFKSDVVARYYDDSVQDLTFYYERKNKHWT